jgi:hypothetical protein
MKWQAANPLSFIKLLTSGKSLAILAVSLGFQCIAEPRFVFPYAQLLWKNKYNYSSQKMGAFAGFFGLIYVAGSVISKKRFKKIGPAKHVTESNLFNTLAFLSWSLFNGDVGTFMSFVLMLGGIRKRDGLENKRRVAVEKMLPLPPPVLPPPPPPPVLLPPPPPAKRNDAVGRRDRLGCTNMATVSKTERGIVCTSMLPHALIKCLIVSSSGTDCGLLFGSVAVLWHNSKNSFNEERVNSGAF